MAAIVAIILSPTLSYPIVLTLCLSIQYTTTPHHTQGDRLPYITEIRDGETPSTIPAWNNMHHNFIVANYAADGGCLDNDDGSSYYDIHHNYCVYGGHKSGRCVRARARQGRQRACYRALFSHFTSLSVCLFSLIDSLAVVCVYLYRSYLDVGIIIRTVLYCTCCWVDFDGNSKISSFNLHVYPSVYGSKCFGELQYMPPKGYAEGYHDNTCILPAPAAATAAASAGGGTGTGGKLPNYGTFGGFGCAPAAYIV